ncbi:MAG: MFS transporter [Rhodospirillales bacterium]|jgi:MFS family permease|nr:MFS transporter [Rhodospirillales bacterium]MBT4039081.1 MFS transporter [Rhodospirillales bacterium]MBT4625482.1 MFS transporter [Rhodospirillales bacterium]MBT5352120.1 MFS transporter [Rhodospirillales bacterium]MBT5521889.1 MFS transporter [Rhodospirillales bacterium]
MTTKAEIEIEQTATGSTLTSRQRTISLVAIYAAVFTWGISYAGLMPLMALTLEGNGYSTLSIGIIGAVTPIGVILVAPFVPFIVSRLGTLNTIFLSSVGSLVMVALLPIFNTYNEWLALRFVAGVFGGMSWIISESWLNSIASEKMRNRITAMYGAVMATSFAVGPFMLTMIGVGDFWPYMVFAILIAFSLIPFALIGKMAPVLNLANDMKISGILIAMPSLLAAALVCGMVDMSMFSFLPIWGLRMGYEQEISIQLLSVFVLGNVVLQLPIAWLAEKTNGRLVLVLCGIVGIFGPIGVTLMADNLYAMGAVLFVWGGCIWALYTVSLAMLGERFKGGSLTAACAAFVVAYEISNIVGPPAAGYAIELWEPHGLMALMSASALLFTVLISARGIYRTLKNQASARRS